MSVILIVSSLCFNSQEYKQKFSAITVETTLQTFGRLIPRKSVKLLD